MPTVEGEHSAQEISDAFVEQYFSYLRDQPHLASQFYVDDSVVTRPGPDGTMISINSVEAINEHILSCDYGNMEFEVQSIDSQNSQGGILIMVGGFLTEKDNPRREFSQVFYLARGDTYVLLNDIFRYFNTEVSTPKTVSNPEPVQGTEVVKPADELKSTELEHEISGSVEKSVNTAAEKNVAKVNNVAAVKNAVAGATTTPLENGKVENSGEKTVPAPKPTEPVAGIAAPQVDGAKRSYASIVQSIAKNNTPFQVKAPAQKPKYMEQPRAAAAPQKAAYVGNPVKNFDQKIKIIEEPGTSIFVANLPMNAIPAQLYVLFKDFGPIKEDGIQVRSSRGQANAVCFGFIAFESATSVQSVLQAAKNTPFMLADRKLRIKEKEVDYNGNKSSVKPRDVIKTPPNGSVDGSKPSVQPRDVINTQNDSADGSKPSVEPRDVINTQNSSADGEDEFKPVRNRKKERRRTSNANGNRQ